MEEQALGELAQSLENQGVLQPIVVREVADGRYELVAGERRWRAAQMVGLMKIPAIVKKVPDERLLELALVENLQREQLNPIEEARAYRALAEVHGLSQQEIARRAGKQPSTVSNTLRLLALPEAVQQRVRKGDLSAGHARALLVLKQPVQQIQMAERILAEGLSVRDVERWAKRQSKPGGSQNRSRAEAERDPNVVAAEQELQRELGTRVRVVPSKSGGGRLELHCYSDEELDGIYELLLDAARRRKQPRS